MLTDLLAAQGNRLTRSRELFAQANAERSEADKALVALTLLPMPLTELGGIERFLEHNAALTATREAHMRRERELREAAYRALRP